MSATQLDLTELRPCDVCSGTGREVDPETQFERRCRVCGGSGTITYDPAPVTASGNPFAGLEQQR